MEIEEETTPAPNNENKSDVDHEAALKTERERSDALEEKLKQVATSMRNSLPETLQKLIPEGLSVADQIDWIKAASTSELAKPKFVPRTDTKPPAIQEKSIDPSELSPVSRIAMSYAATQ